LVEQGSQSGGRAATLIDECRALIAKATAYSREHFEDIPEIRDWTFAES